MERQRSWSTSETSLLVEHYATLGPKRLVSLLPGRSAKAIKERANTLGVQKQRLGIPPRTDPQREVMVGAAMRMWKGPVNREQPMRWKVAA